MATSGLLKTLLPPLPSRGPGLRDPQRAQLWPESRGGVSGPGPRAPPAPGARLETGSSAPGAGVRREPLGPTFPGGPAAQKGGHP